MVSLWNVESIQISLVFGIGVAIGWFFIAGDVITEARENDPDNVFQNTKIFEYLMTFFVPIVIALATTLIVGPVFIAGYSYLKTQEIIFNLNPKLVYIVLVLIIALILDVVIIVSKITFPEYRIHSNTWMFLTLGVLPILIIQ